MTVTPWNPATVVSKTRIAVTTCAAVADIKNPTVAELSFGMGLECAMEDFSPSAEVSNETVSWMCQQVAENLPGNTEYSIEDLVIKASGQNDTDLLTQLAPGDVTYLWGRYGIAHDAALEAGQTVWVWKVQITSIAPLAASNLYVGYSVKVSVLDCSGPVPVQA